MLSKNHAHMSKFHALFQFIEELESMKRRLEETQSRIMTEPASTSPASDDHELAVSTAPPTLKRRTQSSSNDDPPAHQNGGSVEKWTDQVKPIMNRLKVVEHELQEELNSSMKKQQIIEAQQKRIELLVSANERLMATLSQLKDRYTPGDENGENPTETNNNNNNRRQVFTQNHSKVSPVLSASSSVSAASSASTSSSSSTNDERNVPSELSSVESWSPSSTSIPRSCPSPQMPPQPTLPAPVLPQQRAQQSTNSSDQQAYVQMKTTEC